MFTRQLAALQKSGVLDAEGYRQLQVALHEGTTRTDAVRGVPGLFKARWRTRGGGKRGGLRVLYYDCARRGVLYLLLIYPKSEQENLTPEQTKRLARLIADELKPECESGSTE